MPKKPDGRRNNKPSKPGIGGGRERSGELDLVQDNRRQLVLRMRMKWPPLSLREIAKQLRCSTITVMKDIRYLRTEFSSQYFAENNHAAVARACAELEALAHQFLSEAESLKMPMFAAERSSLYGRALQALQQRNDIMMEAGIINKVPMKLETSGPDGKPVQYDITTSSVEQRIAALKLSRQSETSEDKG